MSGSTDASARPESDNPRRKVAVVAGPDPGHAFPAIALCLRLASAGHTPRLYTGRRWVARAQAEGLEAVELPLLAATDEDLDAGARLHNRAAAMAKALRPMLLDAAPDVVVSDVLTAAGGLAADLMGTPWVELSPHPLYLPSRGLPPIGSGLAVGVGVRGRARDALLRGLSGRSVRQGMEHRRMARLSIGLPAADPGPAARVIATLPALELPRPDWPNNAFVVGPLMWDPSRVDLAPPAGDDPLVFVSPSTAVGGSLGVLDAALLGLRGVRMVGTMLERTEGTHSDAVSGDVPDWAAVGVGRQAPLLEQASVVICGAGHGMLAKALVAGKPLVLVPGGGDQKELAARASRQGSAVVLESLTPGAVNDAVREVLGDPRYAAAAQAARAGADNLADPVEIIVRINRADTDLC